jgi:predicted DNA-binding protein with PD1-like motif
MTAPSKTLRAAAPAIHMLRHPGPMPAIRWTSIENSAAPSLRLVLQAGRTLRDAVVGPLRDRGVRACALTVLDGELARSAYCLTTTRADIEQVATYREPLETGALRLVGIGGTLGEDEQGEPLLHCHGLLVDAAGHCIAGHLLTERCVIGPTGCIAYVHVLNETRLVLRYDPHIKMPVFQPEPKDDIHG